MQATLQVPALKQCCLCMPSSGSMDSVQDCCGARWAASSGLQPCNIRLAPLDQMLRLDGCQSHSLQPN